MQIIKDEGSRPIKAWVGKKITYGDEDVDFYVPDIEDTALTQLKNLARLPFIHSNGVAVMPDVHAGIGSTVGTVIATDKAIIPAAVGVDIGCFRGDTRIPLLDGSQATLLELHSRTEPFWVYSIDSELKIAPGLAKCVKTRVDAQLLRVVVSGGDEIFCTPDHKFMQLDGSYKEAADLKFNDSLMPLYRKWQSRDGYESCSNGKGGTSLTHAMVWEAENGPLPYGYVVHHSDHVHFNNQPSNLELMTMSDHSVHHRMTGHKLDNSDPAFQVLRQAGIDRRCADPEKMQQMVDVGKANISAYMCDNYDKFRDAVALNGQRGAKYLAAFNVTPRTCGECGVQVKNPATLRWHMEKEHSSNHKVLSVSVVAGTHDVYCLQVDKHHNFALSAGVFVHNCGMNAVRLTLKADQLPDNLAGIRDAIEKAVPLGKGGAVSGLRVPIYHGQLPDVVLRKLFDDDDDLAQKKISGQLGTLGSGNHFIELCIDENQDVWVMLHSGSRGIGNMIGKHFIDKAKRNMEKFFISLPDADLAYFPEDTDDFDDYVQAVNWAQDYALENRKVMMQAVIGAIISEVGCWAGGRATSEEAVSSHHNYVQRENHFGRNLWVTRKGAVSAREGQLGIIPGSMGQKSYIVRGKGNVESYCSCSHGAGRQMSRTEAKRRFSLTDLIAQTEGVECRKDEAVIDEIPGAYKNLDLVMENQKDLVEVVHTLKAVLCVKGN